jgi:hypothetical protein
MNVAIHQPQYLPWLPYFSKIQECDLFIFLDNVDFQKNGLQNRNQIKTAQGAQWLTVPVKQHLGQKICETKIDNTSDWRRKHLQTIRQCYGKAAEFRTYAEDIEAIYQREWDSLCELNINLITTMLRWMDIRTPIAKSSEMKAGGAASELILNLCMESGATCYISGSGGADYLLPVAFEKAGISIIYRSPELPQTYPQLFSKAGFINHLSALDILLNCGASWRQYAPTKDIQT